MSTEMVVHRRRPDMTTLSHLFQALNAWAEARAPANDPTRRYKVVPKPPKAERRMYRRPKGSLITQIEREKRAFCTLKMPPPYTWELVRSQIRSSINAGFYRRRGPDEVRRLEKRYHQWYEANLGAKYEWRSAEEGYVEQCSITGRVLRAVGTWGKWRAKEIDKSQVRLLSAPDPAG